MFSKILLAAICFSAVAYAAPLSPDPNGAHNVGNGKGGQFITGQCLNNADCASGCCATLGNIGICSGPLAADQQGKAGCGFGGGASPPPPAPPAPPAQNNGAAAPAGAQTGDVTFYAPGLGSCGITSTANEFVAAVGAGVFDNFPGAGPNPNLNPICGKRARVSANGKSVDVTIVDRCPGCAGGGIDISAPAFEVLAPQSVGRIQGASWTFI